MGFLVRGIMGHFFADSIHGPLSSEQISALYCFFFRLKHKFLKLFQIPLSKPISLIANLLFSTGIFSANLKTTNVIPIFKKDDYSSCNSYRSISLLSKISKIIERLIHSRLMTFLNANEILHERQLGFRHNHSTTRAPSAITEKTRQTCDSGNFACGLFLDLQKAFDTVNHDIQQYTTILFLRTIYHSIFNSQLIYACEIWGPNQTNYYFKKLLHLQEKALRIIDFKLQTSPSDCIFKENKILEISDFVNYKYALFVRKSLRRENVVSFNNIFTPLNLNHNHNTRAS